MGSLTKDLGDVADAAVVLGLLKAGNVVLRPLGDNQRYDLVVHREGRFERVQCKMGRLRRGVVVFNTSSAHGHRNKPSKSYEGDADLFGVYCPELDATYLVPVNVAGKDKCSLRVAPSKSRNARGLLATDYALHGFAVHRKPPPAPVFRQCRRCGRPFDVERDSISQSFCSVRCANDRSLVVWPDNDELRAIVWRMPAIKLAEQLGVSSTAVKKRCEARGIPTPERGYWAKHRKNGPVRQG